MNFSLFLSLFLFVHGSANNELAWVNEQIEAIKPPRNGLKDSELTILRNPFIIVEEKKIEPTLSFEPNVSNKQDTINSNTTPQNHNKTKTLKLSMIINDSAFINSKWYKIHEKIYSYTISEITYDSVVLSRKGKKRVLSTKSNLINFNLVK